MKPEYTRDISNYVKLLASHKSRSTGYRVDADELFSAAEYRIARYLASYNPRSGVPFRNWCAIQARWGFQDYMRQCDPAPRRARQNGTATEHMVHIDALPPDFLDFATGGTPSSIEREETIAEIRACVAQLPRTSRRVLEAHFFEGMTGGEFAAREGVTAQAISIRMRNALRKLRIIFKARSAPVLRAA